MSLVVACGNQRFTVTGDEALIGRDPACAISMPDDSRLSARHAALRLVGGRWLIEARSETMLQVGTASPSRLGWLNDGDVIRLTPNGPELVMNPPTPAAASTPDTSTSAQVQTARESHASFEALKKPLVIAAAIIVIVGLLWRMNQATTPNSNATTTPNDSASANTSNEQAAVRSDEESDAAANGGISKPAAVPAGIADSVYAVLVTNEDRQQVYQVGTAWAVSPRQLVTSGAVVLAIEGLRANLGTVLVRHPTTKTEYFVAERAHPRFAALTGNANTLQVKLVELDRQYAQTTDAAEKQTLEQKLKDLDLQLVAQFRETIYFDVGVLDVREPLPNHLERSDAPAANGQRLRLIGVPFPEDEQLLNPDRPLAHREVSGQLLARLPEIEPAAAPIVLNAPLKELQGQQWSGAPVLNAAGQVVGLFSRLAPPDIAAPPDPAQFRPHVTDIRALRELMTSEK